MLLCLTALCVGLCTPGVQPLNPACRLQIIEAIEEHEYIQEGDIMLGGVLTAHLLVITKKIPGLHILICTDPTQQNSKHFLDFRFSIEQLNTNPSLLANLTLGYHIYDSCGDPRKAVRSVLQILSGTREPVPNYSCVGKRNIAGFIGDLTSETTVPIAQILSIYGYSQISYGATDPSLSDRTTFPYFFRTVQGDSGQYYALSKLLRHFSWTWIGIIRSDDDSGEKEVELLRRFLHGESICIEFTVKIGSNIGDDPQWLWGQNIIQKSSSRVIVLCGTVSLTLVGKLAKFARWIREKTFVLPSKWGANDQILSYAQHIFTGSLVLTQIYPYKLDTAEMRDFLNSLTPSNYPDDKLIEDIWTIHLLCLSNNPNKNSLYEHIYLRTLHNCTGQERITDLGNFNDHGNSGRVHLAVNMMSLALHDMNVSLGDQSPESSKVAVKYQHQLHRHLQKVQYRTPKGRAVSFNENGEIITRFGIYNSVTEADGELYLYLVGIFIPWATAGKQLILHSNIIKWKGTDSDIPRAQCSDNCLPGFRKAQRVQTQLCCYDCVRCSEGEISNTTDSANCARCPDLQWPNENKTQCITSTETFLSYTSDGISVVFFSISLLFFLKTVLIFGVFIIYRETPIVRANNRSLSFLLLVSIKLSFLSVFLFLGRPVDITCMLRIITFGITFSIAVSSLLAKTIMVCVAFKATKPGSSWRKWLGVKLSNSVVLFCSSIQIIICTTWLAISPPFQELDIHTSPGTIIIQCNEGSAIGFYSVIGYMGLLAAVSFVLAFLARSLPDSFNEAKYITFSMLLFCSVWITMIPAYLSTKGKNTVCVEIFAILTSSAGLLACIFLPKCYIILLIPENNTKSNLLGGKVLIIS
ncbi:vomeronasal type-2 receptor 26 [Xenopus tropicalis]|uniref:Vomeronasal type-2 receptor 26 n=1 Tax=Xenopus tropicalis TaxID=8364 RepID=A0A8J1IZE7_XENTR|nr:vomeronasal type-2 receptor 26 [Xenopus tropicalis]